MHSFCASSSICDASSRVGAMTTHRGAAAPWHAPTVELAAQSGCPSATQTGIKNAAVLPEPVCAQHIKSQPARAAGTACFWIGVGFWYLISSKLRRKKEGRLANSLKSPRAAKDSAPGPEHSTLMLSYFSKLIPCVPWVAKRAASCCAAAAPERPRRAAAASPFACAALWQSR